MIRRLIKEAIRLHKEMKDRPILYIQKEDGSKRFYKLYLARHDTYRNRHVSIYTPYNSIYCGQVTYLKLVDKYDRYKVHYPCDDTYKDIHRKFMENNTIGHCKVHRRGLIRWIIYRISDYLNFNI